MENNLYRRNREGCQRATLSLKNAAGPDGFRKRNSNKLLKRRLFQFFKLFLGIEKKSEFFLGSKYTINAKI